MTVNKDNIDLCLGLINGFRHIDPEFPLHYALCFLLIAQDPGLSVSTLARRTGLPLSTVSRIVGALSDNRQKGTAYKLVQTRISKTEKRRKELYLTARGHACLTKIHHIISARTR